MVEFGAPLAQENAVNEDVLKRKCVSWMKKDPPEEFWFFCPTDHFYSGIPDVIFCARGRFGSVELKMPKGKVTPIQAWTHDQISKAAGGIAVCRSLDEFKEYVTSFYQQQKKGESNNEE